MKSMIKNTWQILRNTKGFISSMTVWPIIMLLLFSVTLAYSTSHNVAVIDHSVDGTGAIIQQNIENTEGFEIINVKEEEITEKVLAGNIEMAVILYDEGRADLVKRSDNSTIEAALATIINTSLLPEENNGLQAQVNPVAEKGIPITYALGAMLFKFITAGSALAGVLIIDRKSGRQGRIFMSGIHPSSYLGGCSFVHLCTISFTAVVYYLFCLLFNFDFGMQHHHYFLFMVLISIIFSVGVFTFLSTVLEDEGTLWSVSTFIYFPMALFSGALFPYDYMPAWMQNVGALFPQRWIAESITIIQQTNSILPAFPYIGGILLLSIVFFAIASVRLQRMKAMYLL